MASVSPVRVLVAAAVLLVAVAGCATPNAADPPSGAAQPGAVLPGDLVGTWVLDETFDSPERPFITFEKDNAWRASDGCNQVRGTWEVDADGALTTTTGPHTMMYCDGAQLPQAVSLGTRVEVDGDTLIIHGPDSTTTLVRSTDPLAGPPGRPVGYWSESDSPTTPFLSFADDGSYSGNDGCNVLTGSWEQTEDDAILFTTGAMTLMACDGVDQWLSRATQGRVRAGVMTLQSADGTVLGQLTAR